jgi:hypothetical protein
MSNEPRQLHEHIAPGITLVSAEDLKEWLMDIKVLDDNPLYRGETYRLKFSFSQSYPIGMVSSKLPHVRSRTLLTYVARHRSPRSRLRQGRAAPNTNAPARLLQWHHLSRFAR